MRAKRSRPSSGTAWTSRSCARTSSSTSRSTRSTRSRSRRGGSRGINLVELTVEPAPARRGWSPPARWWCGRRSRWARWRFICSSRGRRTDWPPGTSSTRSLKAGGDFPVVAAAQAGADLAHGRRAARREPRARRGRSRSTRPEAAAAAGGAAASVGRQRWLDGEHWLQVRDGPAPEGPRRDRPLAAVRRRQGAGQGPGSAPVARRRRPRSRSPRRTSFDMDPAKRGFLFEHGQDLYYATFDGSTAVRLTNQPGREQLPQFSPDGKSVAFVRDFDLYAVDIASPDRAPADHRRARRPAPRARRLGLLRGDLQPPLAGVLVEPRLEAARVHGVRRRRRAVSHRPGRHGQPDGRSREDPLSPVRRAEPEGPLRRRRQRRRAGAVGRSLRLFRRLVPDQRRGLVAGQLGRLLLRAEPHPDLARPRQVHARRRRRARSSGCSAIRPRPGSRARGRSTGSTTARSSGSASATAGSIIYHYDADGTLRRPSSRRGPGRSAASSTSTPRTAGSTSPARATTRWRRISTASSPAARSSGSRRPTGSHTVDHEPGRKALPVELVRHPDADAASALRGRRPAGPHGRLEPVARAEAAAVRPARAVPDPGPGRLPARGRADPAARPRHRARSTRSGS